VDYSEKWYAQFRFTPIKYHAFTPHAKFYVCLKWGVSINRVTGITAWNDYKVYPWQFGGIISKTVAGTPSTRAVVTIVMKYVQCTIGKDLGCFDSRNVVFEFTIDANSSNRAKPWTVRSWTD
jgi:hypothetical protein